MLRFMDQEVFWLHMSQRLLCLLAMNQFGAPGTSSSKAERKARLCFEGPCSECPPSLDGTDRRHTTCQNKSLG